MSTARPAATPGSPRQSASAAEPVPDFIRQYELPVYFPVASRSTWNRLVRSGEIPRTRVGRAVIVARSDVEAYLTRRSAR